MAARGWENRFERTLLVKALFLDAPASNPYAVLIFRDLEVVSFTVNAVSLGPVQTGWTTPELEKQILPTIPMGRVGKPEDVADVIVFLASDQAGWVTGQRIYVGGGHGI